MPAVRTPSPGLARALRLEWLTIAWNAGEVFITVGAGVAAKSLALVAFGLDSCIEIFASLVVVWELRGDDDPVRTRRALRLVGFAFAALGVLLITAALQALVAGREPHESLFGMSYLAIAVGAMFTLATMKRRVGTEIDSHTVRAEARMTYLDSALATTILLALAVNAMAGWWWADALAGGVVGLVALSESRENLEGARERDR